MTFLLLLFGTIGINTIAQALSLPELQEKLASQQLVRGQYIQTKKMRMFNQPLLSRGDFVLQQKQGLLWLQTQPFPVSLVLTQDKLSQQFDNQAPQIIQAQDNPMVFYFSHLFLSLFKGDIAGLTAQFELHLQSVNEKSDKGQWLLLLTPKSAPLNKVFKQLSISGAEYIDQLELIELNDDSSTIQFINQNSLPTNLTDYEQHYFQF
ncbi:outer membrane lipoprotein carrier protein LolA [Psychromonas sp.]|uniref:LolA family protein n=1 Tax=Psychromonas sp. TaxID=1884585 RepID=UPI0035678E91